MPDKGLFLQNIIAVIWDFDKTLSPQYMQKPIFDAYEVDDKRFWNEVNSLAAYYRQADINIHEDTCYLGHLLSYVRHGEMAGLSNAKLQELGAEIDLFPGLPECFERLKSILDTDEFREGDLRLEHYVVSTGLEAMIRGSRIADSVDGIWASAFIEEPARPEEDFSTAPRHGEITQIAGALDNTTKTRAIFEINKGVNKEPSISVNDTIDESDRRVPFENMIYIADGPSDIPSFSVVQGHGGLTYAVYDERSDEHFRQAEKLHASGRVHYFGVADYEKGSQTDRWLSLKIFEMAQRIMKERDLATKSRVQSGPVHLPDRDPEESTSTA